MEKCMVYCHPSIPIGNIKIGVWYTLSELQSMYDMDYIKQFFTPANFAIEELDKIECKVEVKDEVKNEMKFNIDEDE